jgi:putative restriction endonuclease
LNGYWNPTDPEWFGFLRRQPSIHEVNFWRPKPRVFRAIPEGAPFFFKIRGADVVGGYGCFSQYVELSILEAWDSFGIANGAAHRDGLRRLIAKRRHEPIENTPWSSRIGCIMLWSPLFFEDISLVRRASDWIVQGAQGGGTFSLTVGDGRRVWEECQARAAGRRAQAAAAPARVTDAPMLEGTPYLRESRPGQRIFRASLLAAYGGACAITNEHSVPVLDAAHIRPYDDDGPDRVTNGILVRTDLHRLFDDGYVTVTPEFHFEVGSALRDEFDNGRVYYGLRDELHGKRIRLPARAKDWPDRAALEWHSRERFRG